MLLWAMKIPAILILVQCDILAELKCDRRKHKRETGCLARGSAAFQGRDIAVCFTLGLVRKRYKRKKEFWVCF